MNRLADVIDRSEPTMAVAFTEPMDDDLIQRIATVADVAEFRADKFPSYRSDYLAEQAGRLAVLPVLLTIRCGAEGGGWVGSENERLELFSKLLPLADGVDIELAADIVPAVVEMAHDKGKIVVVSSHSFNTTPSIEVLEEKLASAKETGADYVKFASSAKTVTDFQHIAEFALKHRDENLIIVAMDDYGPMSRIALPALGSCLTYAFPGTKAVAPGQLSYRETHELLKKCYPDYSKLFI